MKILLRENIAKLGIIGDIVEVKPGYARNYLLPYGKAVEPTAANIKAVEAAKEQYLAQLAKQREELTARANAAEGKELVIVARANDEGHLYGSVGPAQVAAVLGEMGVLVDPAEINLAEGYREVGQYTVELRFAEDITASVSLAIKAEGAEEAAE